MDDILKEKLIKQALSFTFDFEEYRKKVEQCVTTPELVDELINKTVASIENGQIVENIKKIDE